MTQSPDAYLEVQFGRHVTMSEIQSFTAHYMIAAAIKSDYDYNYTDRGKGSTGDGSGIWEEMVPKLDVWRCRSSHDSEATVNHLAAGTGCVTANRRHLRSRNVSTHDSPSCKVSLRKATILHCSSCILAARFLLIRQRTSFLQSISSTEVRTKTCPRGTSL